jgi:2,4-dienoyl-CoA reductase-like NADH-dependent reductase (Old Yellow Enzyme family)
LNDPRPVLRCGLRLPNRRALAPLTNTQSFADGTLADVERDWLVRRAAGGFGLVSTCAAAISEDGRAWEGQLGVSSERHVPGLRGLADALRAAGAVSVVQLFHGGAKATLANDRISASDGDGAREATVSDLERVLDDVVQAARRCEEAGFDGVEVHGANGYLFTQFLSPVSNRRSDAYGGDLAGRARLLREAVRAVRAHVSPTFMVAVRVSPVDTVDRRGLVLDEGVAVSRWLADDGADLVHLSLRDAAGPPPFEPHWGPVARAVRDALPADVLLAVAGGVTSIEREAATFAAGADVVVVGRAAIRDAAWARHVDEPGYALPVAPWPAADLAEQGASPRFIEYLRRFPQMVA